eukprot:TRINITY_DN34638_c0_g1_i1.p1 TRINITY_DN34638_c0_g1~~TRINITY_DN34638_c0_g1_i1.p1  ORF type:complete len:396 (+),score=91.39 TRINITY_DN34638_c0_g1_i1:44-1189(+)
MKISQKARVATMRRWCTSTTTTTASTTTSSGEESPKGPFDYIKSDLESIADHINQLVKQKDNKILDHAAGYLLQHKGKMLRPAIVALSGYAAMPGEERLCRELHGGMAMLEMMKQEKRDLSDLTSHPFNRHLRLAEITELVHTASLIHDDVLDESPTRRGQASLHSVVGIKVAVLTGDYLLARASHWLATLGDNRVVLNLSQALEDLTVGEVMQMEGANDIPTYLKKSFNKTSSLIAHSCRGAAILSDPANLPVHDAIFAYGKHLGLAFQIIDDILDFTSTDSEMGKPAFADLKAGVVTLPVLLSAERDAKMKTLLDRKFCLDDDIDTAMEIIQQSEVLEESKAKAEEEIRLAIEALQVIPDTCAKESMIKLTDLVLSRRK